MTRMAVPLTVADLSAFARTLARALTEHHHAHGSLPTHQSLLNHLARAAGHRNWQALRAAPTAQAASAAAVARATSTVDTTPTDVLTPAARKALSQFDGQGRLARWPHKYSVQRLAMWVLWMQFDSRRVYTEREVNQVLKAWNTWGDHVTLRRELINDRLLTRRPDGSEYRKQPARPDAEVRALLAAWRARSGAAARPRPRGAR